MYSELWDENPYLILWIQSICPRYNVFICICSNRCRCSCNYGNKRGSGWGCPVRASWSSWRYISVVLALILELRANFPMFFFNNISAIPSGATVVLASTVSPAFVSQLERRLESKFHSVLTLVVRCSADQIFTSIMILYCHLIEFYNLLFYLVIF